jgi:hypothetical protein
MEKITIAYNSSVFTQAGWRSVEIRAIAKKTSEKMAEVEKVLEIDGEAPVGYTSRTGAKRQTYNAAGIANREIGKKKRINSCALVS